jgi:hypothetical protein
MHPEPVYLNVSGARYRFQGKNSASLCSLAGQYDITLFYSVPSPHRLFKNSSTVHRVHGARHFLGISIRYRQRWFQIIIIWMRECAS